MSSSAAERSDSSSPSIGIAPYSRALALVALEGVRVRLGDRRVGHPRRRERGELERVVPLVERLGVRVEAPER
jgi:hypothetical protein